MTEFQEHVLNDGHVCMNCFGRIRRDAMRPVRYRNADVDADQNRVEDDGVYVASYSERLPWRTTREDVPDEPVMEAGTTFCECGVDGAYVRTWDDDEVDPAHLRDLLENLQATLKAKGYTVNVRQLARRANELYYDLPPAAHPGRGIGPHREGAPTTINEVLAGAVEAGVVEKADSQREVPA